MWHVLFGEKATTKIAAFFATEREAAQVAEDLRSGAEMQTTQLTLVSPFDTDWAKKIEPESQGVSRTAWRSHAILGIIGLIIGLAVWLILFWSDVLTITSTPLMSAVAFMFFASIAGLLLGGLVTIRPDHERVIRKVKKASDDGRWSLIMHPRDPVQCDKVLAMLSDRGGDSTRTV